MKHILKRFIISILPIYDFLHLKFVLPFTQTELDGMKLIEERAMMESKKKINIGLANKDDIIELTIRRKSVELTKPTFNPTWKNPESMFFGSSERWLQNTPKRSVLQSILVYMIHIQNN